ncbi:MAG: alpha-1,2-fucosyltransferase, partial [Sulfurimonas sp.]|nr:alpha-1,2-fucosyltransferase [Sulfurimonas sp.]
KDDFFTHYNLEDIKLKEEIQSSNSVSLHVRRGDYVSNKNATSYHGVSSLDYYYNAIETISKKISNPILYIFSDDIPWVRENLIVSLPIVFIENTNTDRPFEDIYLMSLCKHNIIANSTFSWWGAYLNSNLEKNVIAPKKWFNDPVINTEDLIPSSWTRI